jgi:ATP-dependent DNA ligase I
MRFDDVARASAEVARTRARTEKIALLASLLQDARPDEIPVAVAYLSGSLPHGPVGVGWASLRALPSPAPPPPALGVLDVDAALRRLGSTSGPGSQAARTAELADLFGRATEPEQRFLRGLLTGEVRQGALGGVMVEAVARAADVPAVAVRRALMLGADLGQVATAALTGGEPGLARFRLRPLEPVQPMLAKTAADLGEGLARIHPASVEWKLDGARIQVHRSSGDVRVFTRNLADVTERVPEIVERLSDLEVETFVLDGEAIAFRSDGRPEPFQVTMGRFGSRHAVEQLSASVPLSCFFFDALHLDRVDLIDRPQSERFALLEEHLPPELRVARIVAASAEEAEPFLEETLARGHEGVMVKSLDAPYEAGRRGAAWLKVKRAHTLDLVVLAAEWGHGRRRGWLSNLHLGARDPSIGGFVMLGKTFKGMTDRMLEWQTTRLLELETHRDAYTVFVRPELVVEVAFDGLQSSSRYPGGLALRFARVKGYRPDKAPGEADTIHSVRAIHSGSARGTGSA